MEVLLPCVCLSMLLAGSDMLNLTIWTKERSLVSTLIFLKMALTYMAPFTLLYIFSYIIWSVYLGYNHPMPYIGLIQVPVCIIFMIVLWILSWISAFSSTMLCWSCKSSSASIICFVVQLGRKSSVSFFLFFLRAGGRERASRYQAQMG